MLTLIMPCTKLNKFVNHEKRYHRNVPLKSLYLTLNTVLLELNCTKKFRELRVLSLELNEVSSDDRSQRTYLITSIMLTTNIRDKSQTSETKRDFILSSLLEIKYRHFSWKARETNVTNREWTDLVLVEVSLSAFAVFIYGAYFIIY